MSRLVDVRVPDMGNFKDVAIIDVLVKPGDAVDVDTPLITLETEKATMDVPSTASGIIERVLVSKGGQINPGDVVVAVRTEASEGESAAGAAAPAPQEAPPSSGRESATARETAPRGSPASAPAPARPPPQQVALEPQAERAFAQAHASPSVRKLARELGVALGSVNGTGFKGRITEDDLKAFVKRALEAGGAGRGAARGLPSVPAVDFAEFGPTEVRALSRIQRISGARLHASWVNIPHVTQFDEADITELEALRAELKEKAASRDIKLTPLAFILRACAKALQEFPQFNASLDPSGEQLIFKRYVNIGFAADTANGLLVPVVRDADRKDIYELARSTADLAAKARTGTLSLPQMQGGCFTVSSLGGIGGTAFTPIINAPEVAILGVSRSALKPLFIDGAFVPRLMLPLSLSYDHRVIDGALAVRFTTFLAHALADARGLAEAVP